MTPADHQQKNRLSNQKEMSLTARQLLATKTAESHEGKRYSTTRKRYLNAECYESREKELLVPKTYICLRHLASLARIKALTCTPIVYLLPISYCSSYPTKVVARLPNLAKWATSSDFPCVRSFKWARSRSTKVWSPGPDMEVVWDPTV